MNYYFKDNRAAVEFVRDFLLASKLGSVWITTIEHRKSGDCFVTIVTGELSDDTVTPTSFLMPTST